MTEGKMEREEVTVRERYARFGGGNMSALPILLCGCEAWAIREQDE
jgi:hypothetical protein